MMQHYLGTPYSRFNCLEFVLHALEHEFGVKVKPPSQTQHEAVTKEMDIQSTGFERIDESDIRPGDVIMFKHDGFGVRHIGILFKSSGQWFVAHSMRQAGGVVIHKLQLAKRAFNFDYYLRAHQIG
jgi:cell wall-associated NlpC family hydrolase